MQPKRRQAVLSARVHAAADFDAEVPVEHEVWKFIFQCVLEDRAQMGAVADGQIARVRPWARRHIKSGLKAELCPPQIQQDAVNHWKVGFNDIGQQQVLALRHANVLGGEGRQGVEQHPGALRRFVAQWDANAHGKTSRLFLGHDVGLAPCFMPHRGGNGFHQLWVLGLMLRKINLGEFATGHLAFALNGGEQGFSPHVLVQEFEPGLLTLGTFAFSVEHAQNGFGNGDQLVHGNPLVKHICGRRLCPKSSRHQELEPRLAVCIERRNDPQIVHDAQSGVRF